MKKKVLIVIPTLDLGGAETWVVNLCNAIDKERYDCLLVSLHPNVDSINSRRAQRLGVDVLYLNKKAGFDIKVIGELRRLFKQFKPDVIHTHMAAMYYVFLANPRIKNIHTVHAIPSGKEYFSFPMLFAKMIFHRANCTVVAVSEKQMQQIKKTFKLRNANVCYVYNGVVMPEYENKKSDTKTRFVSVGSLSEVKNHADMIRAFSITVNECYDVQLTLLGDGTLRPVLEELVKDLEIEEKVCFAGNVDNVYDYLNAADIYLSSSLTEANPVSVLEAMATGLPIIANDVGGMGDIVRNNINGILVEVHDYHAMADAMNSLIEDRTRRIELGAASRKIVEDEFCIEKCAKLYEEVYEGRK